MSWFDRFKETSHVGAGAVVAGYGVTNASSVGRKPLDFRRSRPSAAAASGLRYRFVQASRRPAGRAPVPVANVRVQGPLLAATACGKPVSDGEWNVLLLSAQLARAVPALQGIPPNSDMGRRHAKLAGELLVLQEKCASAAEQGISMERVLSALQDRCAGMPALQPRIQNGTRTQNEIQRQILAVAEELTRGLNDCLGSGAVDGKPTREGLAAAALLLAMPGLCPDPWSRPTGQLGYHKRLEAHALAAEIAKDLAVLDARFAGRPGYSFEGLFSVLCNHARILEFGRTEADMGRALAGLRAMVLTVQESIEAGQDGYALDALVGIDGELDKSIASLRIELVEAFMLEHSDPVSLKAESIKADAKELVRQECELALARVRMMRAFDRANVPRPVEVVRGLKMDSTLVVGMVKQLGSRANKVGLAVMGVYLRGQDLLESTSAERMRGCVKAAMDKAKPPIGERNAAKEAVLRALDPRQRSLMKPHLAEPLESRAELMKTLDLADMEMRHVRQLESQGLSSAAEARTALAVVQKARDTWLADGGPERMKQQGLLDVLRTRRQEDRAGSLSEALRAKHHQALQRQPDGSLKPLGSTARRDVLRAAIAHLVPQAKNADPKGVPLLASFCPGTDAVRAVLVSWGRDETFDDAEIQNELLHDVAGQALPGVTGETLARWVRDADLLDSPAGGGTGSAASTSWFQLSKGEKHLNSLVELHATRAAVEQKWIETASHPRAATIRKVLEGWGLTDVPDNLLAEALAEPMTDATFRVWHQDAQAAEAQLALVRSLADLSIGTRVRMNHQETASLSTGTFGDMVGAGAKASVGQMTGVDFGNPGDPGGSYEVVMRAGNDGKLGASASVPLFNLGGVKVGPVASTEVSAQYCSGVILRCTTSQDQQVLAGKLMQKSRLGFDELAAVDSIMILREVQVAGDVGAGVQAMLQPAQTGFSWDEVRKSGLKVGARLAAHAVQKRGRTIAENNRHKIVREESISAVALAATVAVDVRLQSGGANEPNQSAPLFEASERLESMETHKVRTYATPDGKVRDAEQFDQTIVSGKSALERVLKLGGPRFELTMAYLQAENPEVHRNIVALIDDIRPNEKASLAWKADPNSGMHAGNALIEQANALSAHRVHAGSIKQNKASAKKFLQRAGEIFRDRSRYNVARIAAIAVVDRLVAKPRLASLTETSNLTYAESLPEEIKLYAAELVKLTSRAREEMNATRP